MAFAAGVADNKECNPVTFPSGRTPMTTTIFFTLFVLACLLAPLTGADSRRSSRRGWWPAAPR